MSATNTEEQGNVTYYKVYYGKFVKRVAADTEGATKRVNKAGNEVWEIPYSDLTGVITGIKIQDPPEENPTWGKSYQVTFEDGDGKDVVDLDQDLAFMLVARFPNLDLNKEVNIHIFTAKHTGITTNQNGQRIDHAYKDEAPKWEAILDKAQNFVQWDKTDSQAFFEKKILETEFGSFKQEQPSRPAEGELPEAEEEPKEIENKIDQEEPEWLK